MLDLRKVVPASVLVLGALFAGCGGDDSSGDSTSSLAGSVGDSTTAAPGSDDSGVGDPCALLDTDLASTFFGSAVEVAFSNETVCNLKGTENGTLSVSLFAPQTRDDYDRARSTRSNAEDLEGVGEVADLSNGLVQFFSGETIVSIQVVGSTADAEVLEEFVVAQATHAASTL